MYTNFHLYDGLGVGLKSVNDVTNSDSHRIFNANG